MFLSLVNKFNITEKVCIVTFLRRQGCFRQARCVDTRFKVHVFVSM